MNPVPSVVQRKTIWIISSCGILLLAFALWRFQSSREQTSIAPSGAPPPTEFLPATGSDGLLTNIYAHNLRLRQGPNFRVYVQWLRGYLQPAHKNITPSFDYADSFNLNVTDGIIRANLGDINNYLNAKSDHAPLRNIRMSGNGDQVYVTGTLHKLITLPVELRGVIKPASNNRIQIHIAKINVLKIPFKSMLGGLHITLSDFMKSGQVKGMEVEGNDFYFDPQALLPPPHIRGTITRLSVGDPDLAVTYGDASKDMHQVEQWRNFLHLQHGSLAFGKLIMRDVDLMMIDISRDDWFDLDLANYQAQLVSGYTRITPQAGLQIFMPDLADVKKTVTKVTDIEWYKNRNLAPPSEVVPKK